MYDDYDDILDISAPKEEKRTDRTGTEESASSAPVIENLDGTDIDDAQEEKERSEAVSRRACEELKKELSYSEPQSPGDTDPYGVYGAMDSGRRIVKEITIIVAVISAVGLIVSAAKGRGPSALAAAVRILCAYFMLQGKNWGRIVIIISFAASVYSDLFLLFADTGSAVTTKILYMTMFVIHSALGLTLWRNDDVRAYFGR